MYLSQKGCVGCVGQFILTICQTPNWILSMQNQISTWISLKKNPFPELSYPIIWANYSDLTRPHPKWWFSKGIPLISGKSRLVKYYHLARIIHPPTDTWSLRVVKGGHHTITWSSDRSEVDPQVDSWGLEAESWRKKPYKNRCFFFFLGGGSGAFFLFFFLIVGLFWGSKLLALCGN